MAHRSAGGDGGVGAALQEFRPGRSAAGETVSSDAAFRASSCVDNPAARSLEGEGVTDAAGPVRPARPHATICGEVAEWSKALPC